MEQKQDQSKQKNILYSIIIVLAIASLCLRLISDYKFEQTSILFIGLPALIAALLIRFTGTPKSAYGVAFKTMTLFLLMSGILFGEGIVCILFAAPLFYGITFLVVFIAEKVKEKNNRINVYLTIPLIILLGQPIDYMSDPTVHSITVSEVIESPCSLENFNREPDFLSEYPAFFKLGFPKPIGISGTGVRPDDIRKIEFESNTKGVGVLSLKVESVSDNEIRFSFIQDKSHIDHWLDWKSATVTIEEISGTQSRVNWNTEFVCDLGPSWYFVPLEKFAVRVMNQHLINAYFK